MFKIFRLTIRAFHFFCFIISMIANKNLCFVTEAISRVVIFALLVYCCIGIDVVSPRVSQDTFNHPLFRFAVLAVMAFTYTCDSYITILIGFAYLLTQHHFLIRSKSRKISFETPPLYVKNNSDGLDTTSDMFKKKVKSDFTSEQQFNDAQSNIVSDSAMNTEVRTWDDGYGAQGMYKK